MISQTRHSALGMDVIVGQKSGFAWHLPLFNLFATGGKRLDYAIAVFASKAEHWTKIVRPTVIAVTADELMDPTIEQLIVLLDKTASVSECQTHVRQDFGRTGLSE